MTTYLARLGNAIRDLHGCECVHLTTTPVRDKLQGQSVYEVETFALVGHAKAVRCFAWACRENDGNIHYRAVLSLPPVHTPEDAVRAGNGCKGR